jgi:hypothetical protein
MALQNLRSSTAHKRPVATSLSDGQIAINTNAASPGIFFKNSSNVLTKVGPIFIGTSAPNSTPAGSSGNAVGEQWLDTSGGTYALKIWTGSAWQQITGGGATGGGSDAVFFENDQTVTTNYTLTTNKNAVTAGPVTVNSGVTVTIPSGSSWVVV